MKFEISNRFIKLSKKLNVELQKDVKNLILEIGNAENLNNYDIKKMVGHKDYFRIRINKCRIGIKIVNDIVFFEAVAKRDEIYKIFP